MTWCCGCARRHGDLTDPPSRPRRRPGEHEACREYVVHWDTLKKISCPAPEPPGYRRVVHVPGPSSIRSCPSSTVASRTTESPEEAAAHGQADLRAVAGRAEYEGGYTGVKEAVRAWRQEHKEVFLPLSHPPGEGQVDFGEADVTLGARRPVWPCS